MSQDTFDVEPAVAAPPKTAVAMAFGRHIQTRGGFDVLEGATHLSRTGAINSQIDANLGSSGGHRDWLVTDAMTLCLLFHASPELRNGLVYWSSSRAIGSPFEGVAVSSQSRLIVHRGENLPAPFLLLRQSQLVDIGRAGHAAALAERS